MKHNVKNKKLNKTSSHRKAMFMNMSNALLKHEQITTTLAKAKELRRFIEKIITLGKKGGLESRRKTISTFSEINIFSKKNWSVALAKSGEIGIWDNEPTAHFSNSSSFI